MHIQFDLNYFHGGELMKTSTFISRDLKEFLNSSPYAAIYINKSFEIIYHNDQLKRSAKNKCFNWQKNNYKIDYRQFMQENLDFDSKKIIKAIKKVLNGNKNSFEMELSCKKDQKKIFEIRISKFKTGVLILFKDISKKYRSEKIIKDLEQRYKTIFKQAPIGIMLLNEEGEILELNQTLVECSGYQREELEGNNIFDLLVLEKNKVEAKENIKRILKGENLEYIGESLRKSGEIYPLLFKESRVKVPGQGYCVLSMQVDYSEYKKQQQKIEYIGYHDILTACYNRAYIENKLIEIDYKQSLPFGIMIVDINGLALVNESYGYQAGDQLLKKAASKLEELLKSEEIIGRWAGDEFIILFPAAKENRIKELRKEINLFCESTAGDKIPLSLGIGYAFKNNLKEDIHMIINQADQKMNRDKLTKARSSKNKFVKNLINTLGAKSNETKEHALRMTSLAFHLGDRLGLAHEELNDLNLLATLHDIGKVTISESILNKKEKLNEEEWQIIKKHPVKGAAIASSTDEFAGIAKYIRHHHERWDGKGYPDGLRAKEIPRLARIIALIDSYDVMTNERPYKEAMSVGEAIKEIKRNSATQFDPEIAATFIEFLEEVEVSGDSN